MRLQIPADAITDSQYSAIFEKQHLAFKDPISEQVVAEASHDDDHRFMLLCVFLIGTLIFFCGFFALLDKYGEKRHKRRLQHNLSYPSYHSSSDSTLGVEQNENRLPPLTYLVPEARRRDYNINAMSDIEQNYEVDNSNTGHQQETATTSGRSTLAQTTMQMRARVAPRKEVIDLPVPAYTLPQTYPTNDVADVVSIDDSRKESYDIHEETDRDHDHDHDHNHEIHPHTLARDLSERLEKLAEAVRSTGMDPSSSLYFEDQNLEASQHRVQRDDNENIPKWKGGIELQKRVQERKPKRQQRLVDLQSSLSSIAAWARFPRSNANASAASVQQQKSSENSCTTENTNDETATLDREEPTITDFSTKCNKKGVSALLQRYSNPDDLSASELLRDLLSASGDPSSVDDSDAQIQITYSGCSSPSGSSLYSCQNAAFYVQEDSNTDATSNYNTSSNNKKYRTLKDQLELEKTNYNNASATIEPILPEDQNEVEESTKTESGGRSTGISGASSASSTISRGRKRLVNRETSTSLLSQRERKDRNTPYSTIRKKGKFGIVMNNFLKRGSSSEFTGEKEPNSKLSKDKNEKENGKSPSYFDSLGKKFRGSLR